jgi:hypothetical protein
MKLLAFVLLEGFFQKPDNKSYISWGKIMDTPIFLDLFSERRFHLFKFLHFVGSEKGQHCETRYNYENCRVALCAAPFPALPYGGQLFKRHERGLRFKKCLNVRF